MRMPPWPRTQPRIRAASSPVYGLVGEKTNMTDDEAGVVKSPVIWLVGCPIAWANNSAAEAPLAASLLVLCSGEPLLGCARYAAAAMSAATAPGMIQPRILFMRRLPPAAGTGPPRAGRAHTSLRRRRARRTRPPRREGAMVAGRQSLASAGTARAR